MSAYGKVWALTKGPYGRTLALCWEEGAEARVVDVDKNNVFWSLPDSVKLWPHDLALGAAATPLSGAGDRMLALYVAPLCADCGPLEKYVLVPNGFASPAAEQQSTQQPSALAPGQRPPLAHAGSGYHAPSHAHAHGSSAVKGQGGPAAAADGQGDGGKAAEREQAEEQEEDEEEAVEAEEDEHEEADQPEVVQKLKQQLAELQAKVDRMSGQAGGSDNEGFAVFHTGRGHRRVDEEGGGWALGGWGIPVLMVAAVVVIAGLVFVAYQKINAQHRNAALPVQHHPVGNGVLYQQSPTKEEESEAITDRDTARLLRR